MKWRQCQTKFTGEAPSARSGHTAVVVNGNLVVVYGGLFEKVFLGDLVVLDTEHSVWFRPEVNGDQSAEGSIGPGPRAFHCAAALDARLFVFGGRSGRRRLDDFWMLDTITWQWAQLGGFGDRPPARDFAAAAAVPPMNKLVVHGGWDGSSWHSDARVLDTPTLEWTSVAQGASPPPRCGHTATIVETRLLLFGGRSGGAGSFLGDLWALKGLLDDGGGAAVWTKLVLPGPAPSPRCGHTTAAAGTQVIIFGGHGQAGWLTKYDVYHNDVVVLDRKSVQWSRPTFAAADVSPSPRAYHTFTHMGAGRFLLVGGYDGKASLGDVWMLMQDEPSSRPLAGTPSSSAPSSPPSTSHVASQSPKSSEPSAIATLRQQLGLPRVISSLARSASKRTQRFDSELLALGHRLLQERTGVEMGMESETRIVDVAETAREYLRTCELSTLRLADLRALLNDYKWQVAAQSQALGSLSHKKLANEEDIEEGVKETRLRRFYHVTSIRDVKLEDLPVLLDEYRTILEDAAAEQSERLEE